MTPVEIRDLIAEARQEESIQDKLGDGFGEGSEERAFYYEHRDRYKRLADALAALTTPQEAENLAETKRTLDAIFGVERPAPTPQEPDARSPWTRHGHLLPGRTPDENRPPMARCGGPKICRQCSAEAGNVHAHESARATNAGQPIREALAECLFIANTRRDGVGPSDEQWRQYHGGKAFGYRRMADAVLAAFQVLSRAAAPESEWEYGVRGGSGLMLPELFSDVLDAQRFAGPDALGRVVMRRGKAGQWEEVPDAEG